MHSSLAAIALSLSLVIVGVGGKFQYTGFQGIEHLEVTGQADVPEPYGELTCLSLTGFDRSLVNRRAMWDLPVSMTDDDISQLQNTPFLPETLHVPHTDSADDVCYGIYEYSPLNGILPTGSRRGGVWFPKQIMLGEQVAGSPGLMGFSSSYTVTPSILGFHPSSQPQSPLILPSLSFVVKPAHNPYPAQVRHSVMQLLESWLHHDTSTIHNGNRTHTPHSRAASGWFDGFNLDSTASPDLGRRLRVFGGGESGDHAHPFRIFHPLSSGPPAPAELANMHTRTPLSPAFEGVGSLFSVSAELLVGKKHYSLAINISNAPDELVLAQSLRRSPNSAVSVHPYSSEGGGGGDDNVGAHIGRDIASVEIPLTAAEWRLRGLSERSRITQSHETSPAGTPQSVLNTYIPVGSVDGVGVSVLFVPEGCAVGVAESSTQSEVSKAIPKEAAPPDPLLDWIKSDKFSCSTYDEKALFTATGNFPEEARPLFHLLRVGQVQVTVHNHNDNSHQHWNTHHLSSGVYTAVAVDSDVESWVHKHSDTPAKTLYHYYLSKYWQNAQKLSAEGGNGGFNIGFLGQRASFEDNLARSTHTFTNTRDEHSDKQEKHSDKTNPLSSRQEVDEKFLGVFGDISLCSWQFERLLARIPQQKQWHTREPILSEDQWTHREVNGRRVRVLPEAHCDFGFGSEQEGTANSAQNDRFSVSSSVQSVESCAFDAENMRQLCKPPSANHEFSCVQCVNKPYCLQCAESDHCETLLPTIYVRDSLLYTQSPLPMYMDSTASTVFLQDSEDTRSHSPQTPIVVPYHSLRVQWTKGAEGRRIRSHNWKSVCQNTPVEITDDDLLRRHRSFYGTETDHNNVQYVSLYGQLDPVSSQVYLNMLGVTAHTPVAQYAEEFSVDIRSAPSDLREHSARMYRRSHQHTLYDVQPHTLLDQNGEESVLNTETQREDVRKLPSVLHNTLFTEFPDVHAGGVAKLAYWDRFPDALTTEELCIPPPPSLVELLWQITLWLVCGAVGVGLLGLLCLVNSHPYYRAAQLLFAAGVGGAVSVGIFVCVNHILVQITLSAYVAFAFGLVFVLLGCFLAWKTLVSNLTPEGELIGSCSHFCLLLNFAVFMTTSGVLCFLVDQNWTGGMSASTKIPIYSILGVSVCFCLIFFTWDILFLVLWKLGSLHHSRSLEIAGTEGRFSIGSYDGGSYDGFVSPSDADNWQSASIPAENESGDSSDATSVARGNHGSNNAAKSAFGLMVEKYFINSIYGQPETPPTDFVSIANPHTHAHSHTILSPPPNAQTPPLPDSDVTIHTINSAASLDTYRPSTPHTLTDEEGLLRSVLQIRLLAVASVICGSYYGLIFGYLDLEDMRANKLPEAVARESTYCYPLAAVVGSVVAVAYWYIQEVMLVPVSFEDMNLDDTPAINGDIPGDETNNDAYLEVPSTHHLDGTYDSLGDGAFTVKPSNMGLN